MPNDDHSTPADNAPDRWYPETDGDPPYWAYPPRFEPDDQDARDLRRYFAQGPAPTLTTKQRRGWHEIDRALAGGGHRLFLCFTRGGAGAALNAAEVALLEETDRFGRNDPSAEEYREMLSGRAPVDLDEERRWRRWAGLVAYRTVPLLREEYADSVRRREALAAGRRPGRPRRDRNPQIDIELPFDTVKDVLWVDTAERAPRVYWREVEPGRFEKEETDLVEPYTDRPAEKLAALLAGGNVTFTTWGAIRLHGRYAIDALFPGIDTLGMGAGAVRVAVERAAAEQVARAQEWRAWLDEPLPDRLPRQPKDRARERSRQRAALLDVANETGSEFAAAAACDLARPETWAEDDELHVADLAAAFHLSRRGCSDLLLAEGVRGKRVSVFWLSTDAGRRFVGRAQAEAKRAFSARSRRGSRS